VILLRLLALVAGVVLLLQIGVNMQHRSALGSPLTAVSFIISPAGLAGVALVLRATPNPGGMARF
jgi:uncharacterized membrane protein YdcZ (DUF606 family)